MSLGRHISIIGFHTTLGRFLGYLRDTLVIGALGATALTDALFLSAKIASLFRRLFVEGAFNASFIPIFGSLKEKEGIQKATSFGEQSLMWMLMIIGIITVGVLTFTDSFVSIIAAGFRDDPEKLQWTIELTRIVFPFILIICLTAVLGSVLNAMHNYVQTAASQTVGNLGIILLFLAFLDVAETKAHAAAWAILGSSVIQFIWLYVVAVKMGVVMRPQWPKIDASTMEFFKRLLPGMFGTGMVQINVMISIFFGSYLQDGGVSYLQITERVNQFPLSIIGVSLGTILIPMLTTEIQQHSMDKALDTQNKAIELSLVLSLPICVVIMMFASPILATLFMYGKFSEADVWAAAPCLVAFISGLPAYVLLKVFSSTFFALKDTLRPSIAGGVAMAVNAVLCYLIVNDLIWPDLPNHVGIAIALSISGWINTIVLAVWSYAKGYFRLNKQFIHSLIRITAITTLLAAICYGMYPWILVLGFDENMIYRWVGLGIIVVVASATYYITNVYYKKVLGIKA